MKKIILVEVCCVIMLICGVAYACSNLNLGNNNLKENQSNDEKIAENISNDEEKDENKNSNFKLGNNFLIVEDSHYLDQTIENHRETGRENELTFINGYLLMSKYKHKFGKTYKYEDNAIDIYAPVGSKVLSLADGIVKEINFDYNYGNYIIIKNNEDFETIYTHLDNITINEGDNILEGEEIGTSGMDGTSIAPHLHIELHYKGNPVNPLDYIEQDKE